MFINEFKNGNDEEDTKFHLSKLTELLSKVKIQQIVLIKTLTVTVTEEAFLRICFRMQEMIALRFVKC